MIFEYYARPAPPIIIYDWFQCINNINQNSTGENCNMSILVQFYSNVFAFPKDQCVDTIELSK